MGFWSAIDSVKASARAVRDTGYSLAGYVPPDAAKASEGMSAEERKAEMKRLQDTNRKLNAISENAVTRTAARGSEIRDNALNSASQAIDETYKGLREMSTGARSDAVDAEVKKQRSDITHLVEGRTSTGDPMSREQADRELYDRLSKIPKRDPSIPDAATDPLRASVPATYEEFQKSTPDKQNAARKAMGGILKVEVGREAVQKLQGINEEIKTAAVNTEKGLVAGAQVAAGAATSFIGAPGVGALLVDAAMHGADKHDMLTPSLEGKKYEGGAFAKAVNGDHRDITAGDVVKDGLSIVPGLSGAGGQAAKGAAGQAAGQAAKAAAGGMIKATGDKAAKAGMDFARGKAKEAGLTNLLEGALGRETLFAKDVPAEHQTAEPAIMRRESPDVFAQRDSGPILRDPTVPGNVRPVSEPALASAAPAPREAQKPAPATEAPGDGWKTANALLAKLGGRSNAAPTHQLHPAEPRHRDEHAPARAAKPQPSQPNSEYTKALAWLESHSDPKTLSVKNFADAGKYKECLTCVIDHQKQALENGTARGFNQKTVAINEQLLARNDRVLNSTGQASDVAERNRTSDRQVRSAEAYATNAMPARSNPGPQKGVAM